VAVTEDSMQLVMVHDLTTTPFGAPQEAIYEATLEMSAWADAVGFDLIALGEHHATSEGYDPSPIVAAAAIAARTRRIAIRTSVLLAPLYEPVKLAEDLAVASIFSRGRLLVGIGAGYRQVEYEMFGQDIGQRWERMGEIVAFLKRAWTGEPFEFEGRRVHVTPKPEPPPPILLGGAFARSARRAAHIADGWLPRSAALWEPYRKECIALGRPDPGPPREEGPVFLHVSKDPEAAWQRVSPHVAHMLSFYGSLQDDAPNQSDGPYSKASADRGVPASGAYRVLTPEQVIELANSLGPEGILYATPLLCGLDPAMAWESLGLLEREVLPYLPSAPPAEG